MFSWENLKNNWKAWLTVALINIPLSISLAVASGATPLQWLITWIWSGLAAAVFASSNYNIFGVAGALSSILMWFVIANPDTGVYMLPIIAICSGIIALLVYVLKITKYITMLPSVALHGFLIAVGVTIALQQLAWWLWLNDPSFAHLMPHKEIYMNIYEVFKNIWSTNIYALLTFLGGLIFLIICKKRYPNFPAVIVITIVWILIWLAVKYWRYPNIYLLSDKYPELKFSLYQFTWMNIKIDNIWDFWNIIKPILSLSALVSIISILETIISAKIAEKITKEKFDKDKEILWLWLSNLASWIMWWLPSTAVFIRTSLNIKSWANNKLSWFLTAMFTLVISALLFNGFFKYLPFPIIAAILMNIALWLIDIQLLKKLYSMEKTAFWITIVTTVLAVLDDPIVWILVWTIISLLIFLKKTTKQWASVSIFRDHKLFQKMNLSEYINIQKEWDLILLKFNAWLSYLNIERNIELMEQIDKWQKVILSFSHVPDVDIDGIEAMDHMVTSLRDHDIDIYISGSRDGIEETVHHFEHYEELHQRWRITRSTTDTLQKLLHE